MSDTGDPDSPVHDSLESPSRESPYESPARGTPNHPIDEVKITVFPEEEAHDPLLPPAGLVLEQPAELGPSITTQILDHHEDDEEGDLIIDDDLVDLDSYHEELDIGYDDEEDHEHEHDLEHDLEREQVVILEAVELQEQEKKPQERHQEEEEDEEEEEEEDEEDDEDEEVSLEGDNIDLVYHDELTGLRPVSVVKPEISMIVKDPRESGLITLADGRHVFPAEHLKKQNQTKSGPDWVFICCSGIGHLCVIMSIIGLIVLHLERDRRAALAAEKEVDPADPAAADLEHAKYFLIPVVACSLILAICYLSLLCEACVSDTRAYTRTVHDVQTLQEHVETRKRVTPKVELTVTCYHTHGSKTRSKQVTYKKTEEFKYTRCVDSSGCVNTSLFSGGSLTRYVLTKEFGFLDRKTRDAFEHRKRKLYDENKSKDDNTEVFVSMHLEGFRDTISVYVDSGSQTMCMKQVCFWSWTVFLLTWPYRWWFNCRTREAKFTYLKLIGL